MTDRAAVDAYIEAQPAENRAALQAVRAVLRASLPDAAEIIAYKMPAYLVAGRHAVYFAGWTAPVPTALIAALAKAITRS